MRRALITLLSTAALTAGLVAAAPSVQADTASYYLALGDSLSVGYQPAASGTGGSDTDQGYVDDLYNQTLLPRDPELQLVKLGCSGETTTTMIDGGKCVGRYATGSQLGDAVAFLSAHPGQVKYLTIDIGANDVDGCTPGGSIDAACLVQGVATITQNLNTILAALKKADGGAPLSIGMSYYDPFLQYWTTGTQGQLVATASVGLLTAINTAEQTLYALYGFRVADVFDAYKTLDFTSPTLFGTPVNVQTICNWTYMCTLHNIHPNPTGYQKIADAFAAKVA